jgi:Flp pilus assembly protein TadG
MITRNHRKLTPTKVPRSPQHARVERACRRAREEDGSALVEFTLLLPLLLLILFGVLDFGRAINYWIDESQLANVGARYAAVNRNPGSGSTLQESIRNQADTAELRDGGTSSVPSAAQVCIDFPNGSTNVGDPVETTVSVSYNWMPFLGDQFDVATTTMTSSATMRLEQAPSEYGAGCS